MTERDELASVISHRINFDDGAHHLSMGDDGEPCRACQDVADAVLAAGFRRAAPQEPTAPVAWRIIDGGGQVLEVQSAESEVEGAASEWRSYHKTVHPVTVQPLYLRASSLGPDRKE
jgi:hypothetical protein